MIDPSAPAVTCQRKPAAFGDAGVVTSHSVDPQRATKSAKQKQEAAALINAARYRHEENVHRATEKRTGDVEMRKFTIMHFFLHRFITKDSRFQWPRGLRLRSVVASLPGLWVRIPPGAWI